MGHSSSRTGYTGLNIISPKCVSLELQNVTFGNKGNKLRYNDIILDSGRP